MNYCHSMSCQTQGIRALRPAQWRGLDGLIGVYWDAEGARGAHAYYLSPDPRIVFFLNDVSAQIRVGNDADAMGRSCRPMCRAVYVPAGVPIWTRFAARHSFSHLDLHIHKDRLLRFLTPSLGLSQALSAMRRPVEIQDVQALDTLAHLLIDEVATPRKHGVYAENLVGSIFSYLLEPPLAADDLSAPGLSDAQLNSLRDRLHASPDRKLSVAEMADSVGLSESWFAHVFKDATGTTPLQWQQKQRVELAQHLLLDPDLRLADIAMQLGFADQAHLTRVFRQICGQPPATWRRQQHMAPLCQ